MGGPRQHPQQAPATRNPFENVEERLSAYSQSLDAQVSAGRISQSDKVYLEKQFGNKIEEEQHKYDQRLAKAHERMDAAKAQNAQEQQREMASARDMARDRD